MAGPFSISRDEALPGQALALAVEHQKQGRLLEAERLYRGIFETNPKHFDALHLLGVVRQQQGRSAEALELLSAALKVIPNSADALSNKGVALKTLERFDEALASYDRALAIKPYHVDALSNRGLVLTKLRRFDEALASCDRALALKPDHVGALNGRGNALSGLGRHEEALASLERALALRPNDVDAIVNMGGVLQRMGRLENALALFDHVLSARPDDVETLSNRGVVLLGLKRYAEALASCDRALAVRPDHLEALNNRGSILVTLNRCEEAIASCDRALARNPMDVPTLSNRGIALGGLNRLEEALGNFDRALAIEPGRAEVRFNRGLALIASGRMPEGWADYEWRWQQDDWADRRRNFSQPVWKGEDLRGKTILLHAEQGFGDTIQFVRYAPMVAELGAKVVLEVPAPMVALLSSSLGSSRIVARGEPLPRFDAHCPLMSLPLAFGTSVATIPGDVPYVRVPHERLEKWKHRLGHAAAPRVGIAWAGSAEHRNNHHRSIALSRFAALFDADAEFVSLQKEMSAEDAEMLRNHKRIIDIGREISDFADTAAVISLVDFVVSVDTSVAHLAGAMGRAVFLLLPFSPDFRWMLDREDSPWYPTARLFRQKRTGDWESVLRRVREELVDLAKAGGIRPRKG